MYNRVDDNFKEFQIYEKVGVEFEPYTRVIITRVGKKMFRSREIPRISYPSDVM